MLSPPSAIPLLALSALLGFAPALAWVSSAAGSKYSCGGTGPENYFATVCASTASGTALTGFTSAIVYSDEIATDYAVTVTCSYGSTVCSFDGDSSSLDLIASSTNTAACVGLKMEKKRSVSETLYTSCPKLGKAGSAYLESAVVESGSDGPTLECQYAGATASNSAFTCSYFSTGEMLSSSGAATYCPSTGCSALASRKKRSVIEARSKRSGSKANALTVEKRQRAKLAAAELAVAKRHGGKREANEAEAKRVLAKKGDGFIEADYIGQWADGSTVEELTSASVVVANMAVATPTVTAKDYSNQWTEGNRS